MELNLPTTWVPGRLPEDLENKVLKRLEYINIDLPEIRKEGLNKSISVENTSELKYNRNIREFRFKLGDKLLRYVDVPKENFSPTWEGPFTIECGDFGANTIRDEFGNYDNVNGDKLKS
ncbi:hypothetical protein AYI70_g9081 [Smittium culicis]|uniref:Uncharacterized protein n=1 Tax=Smittium culicis TaxID=133412 RepID=A0A1R1XD04_9FUNG|nr:hypothetical protein AYI70_g9081 [Smittium culicis]